MPTLYGNQQVLSGNYGTLYLAGQLVGAFKSWTLNYGDNLTPEGQTGTGTPILVPGMNTVTVTASRLMIYGASLVGLGIEPASTLNDIWKIAPFSAKLMDQLSSQTIKTAEGLIFDSASMSMPANSALIQTFTFMGTDVSGQPY